MAKTELEVVHRGIKFTVVHCERALESFREAMGSVEARKQKKFEDLIMIQIKRLASGQRMSNANFPFEGDLPKRSGQQNAQSFRAIKKIPLRGYCWLSERVKNTYYISHYVHKNYDKLKARDVTRVGSNWRRIEENGDER